MCTYVRVTFDMLHVCFVENASFEVTMEAAEIFQKLPLGYLLTSMAGMCDKEVLKFYIEDFVHTVYSFQSEAEFQVKGHIYVCERNWKSEDMLLLLSIQL